MDVREYQRNQLRQSINLRIVTYNIVFNSYSKQLDWHPKWWALNLEICPANAQQSFWLVPSWLQTLQMHCTMQIKSLHRKKPTSSHLSNDVKSAIYFQYVSNQNFEQTRQNQSRSIIILLQLWRMLVWLVNYVGHKRPLVVKLITSSISPTQHILATLSTLGKANRLRVLGI